MTAVAELTKEQHEQIHHARTGRTVIKHKEEWYSNIKANADNIKRDLSLLWLDRSGGEIISIAAGPSLSEDIDKIRKLKKKGMEVIAVDAALKFCVENGIIPNYVICTDASEKILGMWEGMPKVSSALILNVMANPKVVEYWGENIYWFVMASMIYDKDHERLMQDMHCLASKVGTKLIPGGNVSSVSLGFCLSVRNASKVHMFGHDFCWKNDFYCGGQMKDLERERIVEERKANTIFEMKNTRGEEVLTNLSLKQFAIWHEQALAHMKHRVVNHTRSTILNV